MLLNCIFNPKGLLFYILKSFVYFNESLILFFLSNTVLTGILIIIKIP